MPRGRRNTIGNSLHSSTRSATPPSNPPLCREARDLIDTRTFSSEAVTQLNSSQSIDRTLRSVYNTSLRTRPRDALLSDKILAGRMTDMSGDLNQPSLESLSQSSSMTFAESQVRPRDSSLLPLDRPLLRRFYPCQTTQSSSTAATRPFAASARWATTAARTQRRSPWATSPWPSPASAK